MINHCFQGFHILTDSTNAFAGLTSSCIEHLRDEYTRQSILMVPLIPSYFSDNDFNTESEEIQSLINDSVRVVNLANAFNEFSTYCNLVVPLSTSQMGWRQPGPRREFQHINYNVSIFLTALAPLLRSLAKIYL